MAVTSEGKTVNAMRLVEHKASNDENCRKVDEEINAYKKSKYVLNCPTFWSKYTGSTTKFPTREQYIEGLKSFAYANQKKYYSTKTDGRLKLPNAISYTQDSNRWSGINKLVCPPAVPKYADCSSFTAWAYWSVFGKTDDILNGQSWKKGNLRVSSKSVGSKKLGDSKYTAGTVITESNKEISKCQPGDAIFSMSSKGVSHVKTFAGKGPNNEYYSINYGSSGPATYFTLFHQFAPSGDFLACVRYDFPFGLDFGSSASDTPKSSEPDESANDSKDDTNSLDKIKQSETKEQSECTKKCVSASSLNIRSGPGTNFSKVGKLKKGSEVCVVSVVSGFAKLSDDNYVSDDYLESCDAETPSETESSTVADTEPSIVAEAESSTVAEAESSTVAEASTVEVSETPVETPDSSSDNLIAELIKYGDEYEANVRNKKDDGKGTKVPYSYIQKLIKRKEYGLLSLILTVANWGVSDVPSSIKDPLGSNWSGSKIDKNTLQSVDGKHCRDYIAGLGILHLDGDNLKEVYNKFGKPDLSDSILFSVNSKGKKKAKAIFPASGKGLNQYDAFKKWGKKLMYDNNKAVEHVINKYLNETWKKAVSKNKGAKEAMLYARIYNSLPSLANKVAGKSFNEMAKAYVAYKARYQTRVNRIKRAVVLLDANK